MCLGIFVKVRTSAPFIQWHFSYDILPKLAALTVRVTMVFTITMDEVWSWSKRAIDLIFPMPEDLRKVLAELKLSSAAEILSTPKNH